MWRDRLDEIRDEAARVSHTVDTTDDPAEAERAADRLEALMDEAERIEEEQ